MINPPLKSKIMRLLFKISYYLRTNHKNKEGKCSVMIRISLNGEMINLGTSGLAVVPEKWDNRTGRMKSKTAEALLSSALFRDTQITPLLIN